MSETWKPIEGYEGAYEVSDLARVRSLARTVVRVRDGAPWRKRFYPGQLLKQSVQKGYLQVTLCKGARDFPTPVHVLVARHFVDGRFAGAEVCHGDGDKLNCLPGNLRWDTHLENMRDMFRQGGRVAARGTAVGNAALAEEDVLWIRANANALGQREMGRRLGVVHTTVRAVILRKTWTHV